MYSYKCLVERVIDGDSVVGIVDLGFGLKQKMTLRLFGINAPEIRGKQKADGLVSKDWLQIQVEAQEVTIQTIKDRRGKYGRILAIIHHKGVEINKQMVDLELAKYVNY